MAARANKLITEKSPYLLQHAHNPVNWFPWGTEAFNLAKERNVPIFLSIGYFSCHWCHVLEHESFQNQEIADVMNQHFVNIKVDREERPEIDKVYMTFVQLTTGHGGWPLSVWLTPDLKPFYGGTYYPPTDRFGRPGFKTILLAIAERWKNNREKLIESGNELAEVLKSVSQSSETSKSQMITEDIVHSCFHQLRSSFDKVNGGFSTSPKFPTPPILYFLTRYYALQKPSLLSESSLAVLNDAELKAMVTAAGISINEADSANRDTLVARFNEKAAKKGRPAEEALGMCLHTLRKMAKGGIHDHIAQGFHRYSTDKIWHVPHFEKMLYDQSQLASGYLRAYQITREPLFAQVAEDIFAYVSRDLKDKEGGFYCAEDADSKESPTSTHALEGAFYVWTFKELEDLLERDVEIFAFHYGVEKNGNVAPESDIQGELTGKNCLFEKHDVTETAKKFEVKEADVEKTLASCRKRLFEAQKARPRPNLDDKIVTSWNGLMISAFSEGYQILGDKTYLSHALHAAEFFYQNMYNPATHVLLRSYRGGPSNIEGFADDYAFLIQGLLDLYDSTLDEKWLKWAVSLQHKQDELFWDEKARGYFASTGRDPSVIVRMKDEDDSSEPSAGSVSALNLFRLSNILDDSGMAEKVNALFQASAYRFHRAPHSIAFMCSVLSISMRSSVQIVIVGSRDSADTKELLKVINAHYLPNRILMLADPNDTDSILKGNTVVQQCHMVDGKATAYCCRNFQCSLPVTEPKELAKLLTA